MQTYAHNRIASPGGYLSPLPHLLLFILFLALSFPLIAYEKSHPGQLVDIGSHRLHIHCIGSGSPTVIIDSGIGGFSLEWHDVQNHVGKHNRVCAYDRAGYGYSDIGPMPRTSDKIAKELYALLQASGEQGPFLMVGHSFGGYNIRYFARLYPELVAGFVLVDASHPGQFDTLEFKRVVQKPKPVLKQKISIRMIRPVIAPNFPNAVKQQAFMLMQSPKAKMTLLNEMDFMEASAHKLNAQMQQRFSFPITVITRGKRVWPHDKLGDQREAQWFKLQAELSQISLHSRHVFAMQSGHIVHIDQPQLVATEIMTTLDAVVQQQYERAIIEKYGIKMVHNFPVKQAIMNLRQEFTPYTPEYQPAYQQLNAFFDETLQTEYSNTQNIHWVVGD